MNITMTSRIIGALAAIAFTLSLLTGCSASSAVSVAPLERGSIETIVTANGRIESDDCAKVYSYLGARIEAINVEVGDRVSEGDILCTLDSSDIEEQIIEQQAAVEAVSKANEYKETTAQENLRTAQERYNSGLNANVSSAKNAYEAACLTLTAAEKRYDEAKRITSANLDSQITSFEQTVILAKTEYDKIKKDYDRYINDYAKLDFHGQEEAKTEHTAWENKLSAAKTAVDNAEESLRCVKEGKSVELSQYERAVNDARAAAVRAQADAEAADRSAKLELANLSSAAEREKLYNSDNTAQIHLDNLKSKLEETSVKAPCDGTVTAVMAQEGANASGLMFVVENTDELIVKANVKETNINKISVGMPVTLTAAAVDGVTYTGTVKRVAPSANKNADGSDAADGSFEVIISVDNADGSLAIGMTVKAKVITETKENVLVVDYSAISGTDDGSSCVYAAEIKDGQCTARCIPVEVYARNDSSAEISGDGLKEGMTIITTSAGVTEGKKYRCVEQNNA